MSCLAVKHIPSWFPGAEFKRQSMIWKPIVDEMFERPYHEIKANFVSIFGIQPRPNLLVHFIRW